MRFVVTSSSTDNRSGHHILLDEVTECFASQRGFGSIEATWECLAAPIGFKASLLSRALLWSISRHTGPRRRGLNHCVANRSRTRRARLELVPTVEWSRVGSGRKTFSCPSALPHLESGRALATVELPHHLAWSGRRSFALSDRRDRVRVYEVVLTDGLLGDIESLVDGALLVDLWDDLYLRMDIRRAWQPLVDQARGG